MLRSSHNLGVSVLSLSLNFAARSTMQGASSLLPEPDCLWEICSATDTDETADNLPGHGRLLGNFYSLIGCKFETKRGHAADRIGLGPLAIARKIRRIVIENEDGYIWNSQRKKAGRKCKQLVRYVK